ncbi:hypothetical protein P775_25570 [Puniceibacterium antarcticum]|uniref:Multidrug resistance protein MdtA-like barrel-sandwich hybrid domain-containing protein n=1 Tax=Puniceibacterium antarcticum TaxID=1206336 RepID=A0A2G8R1Y5_9RHOB|nr:HlyD family efflux transporter periplasmic adaptor subunit [Puniceibacterium antarcticum]PIL15550.1 hypothetical protein P775_25570 [Puniceibacterium antarcticum]
MRFLRQSLTGLFLASLTLGLLVYAAALVGEAIQVRMADKPHVPQNRERVFAVNTVRAEAGAIAPGLTAFGRIQSSRSLELRAAATGRLIDFAPEFEEGGRVTEGQLLARVDPAEAQAELDRAQSDVLDGEAETREAARGLDLAQDDLASAAEQAELYERQFQRQVELKRMGAGTDTAADTAELSASTARGAVLTRRKALAEAEARVDQAVTTLSRAEIARSEAERQLKDTEIRAGFNGTLSAVSVIEGRLVSANEQLAQLIDAEALEVVFRVSTQQYTRLLDDDGRLRQSPVTVTLDVYGTDLVATGVLTREGAEVGEGQTGRQLFARLDAARGLKPGDFVTVTIDEAPLNNVVRLPSSALSAQGDVLVLGAEDRLEVLEVQLLRRQGDDVLVRAAALEGRDVVVERTPLLGAGIKVRALSPAGAAPVPEANATPAMLELSDERRARLIALVEGNGRMPDEAKQRILAQLGAPQVPAQVVERLEARIGG